MFINFGENAYQSIGDRAPSGTGDIVSGFLGTLSPENANKNIPSNVNSYSLNKEETENLLNQFKAADAANGEAMFDKCAELYKTYKDSETCTQNGKEFYNTMKTIADTGTVATDADNAFGGDYLEYYKSYMNEMSNLYEQAKTESEGGILIAVTMENGTVKCGVSPSSADLRNSN